MPAIAFAAALTLAVTAQPAIIRPSPPPEPKLTAPQTDAFRCALAFGIGAQMQAKQEPQASDWPPLEVRGKEFFVRTMAKLIDDTGLERGALQAYAVGQAGALRAAGDVPRIMPGCLVLLDASGV